MAKCDFILQGVVWKTEGRDDHNPSMQRLEDVENHAVQPIKICF